jgi:hypothetical protein
MKLCIMGLGLFHRRQIILGNSECACLLYCSSKKKKKKNCNPSTVNSLRTKLEPLGLFVFFFFLKKKYACSTIVARSFNKGENVKARPYTAEKLVVVEDHACIAERAARGTGRGGR